MAQFPAVSIGDAAGLRDVGTLHSQLLPLSQAVELLTGQRGTARAVMTDAIGIDQQDMVKLATVHAPTGAVTSAAGGVPKYSDFLLTVEDLYQLQQDVLTIQKVLNLLIKNLST